ncbi:MAG: c-type cytochrome [Planctomycetota bacterium]|nr:c-type cytochrome [Planctomycetota bacterium]
MRTGRIFLVSAFSLIACDKGSETPAAPAPVAAATVSATKRAGDLLFARSNCVACHAADPAVTARVGELQSPKLDRIGARASAKWISNYLSTANHTGSTGMRMPNILRDLEPDAKVKAIRQLTAYLSSLREGTTPSAFLTTRPSQQIAGEKLWLTVGCTACHPAAPSGDWLTTKWNATELASFLKDPTSVWPSGQMPKTNLSDEEIQALASWLLRGQGRREDGSSALTKAPGIAVDYFEGALEGNGPTANDLPTRSGIIDQIGLPSFARADAWGARFAATLTIPVDGQWTFWLGSDDGSSLSIDGNVLIEMPGVHGLDWKKGTKMLTAGPHEILVTYFEGAGNADLRLDWIGPEQDRQEIPASAFTREAIELRAPTDNQAEFNDSDIAQGRELFVQVGCVQCHGSPEIARATETLAKKTYKPLENLNPALGCLANDPPLAAADYTFTASERDSLRALVANAKSLLAPLPAEESLALHLLALNCTGCHSRKDVGQPTAEAMALFAGTADLGEQGRVPPTLDDAGAKLRTSAITEILAGNGRVRPYVLTRMPIFGAASSKPFPALLAAADHAPREETDSVITEEMVAAGTRLAGLDGLACITCHGISGYPSLGVPAIDLSYTYARLRHSWFEQYMRNPAAIYPGTRMPTFWQKGQRIQPEVCGGDPTKQIEAIWTYLSLGSSMPLPKGMVAGNEYDLIPQERPIVLGTFMDGLSARCFAVGFPEQIHFVYDGDHRRTAKAWRGKFMDAAGTWFGRAGLLCEPAGFDVIDFPMGDAVAILANSQSKWPEKSGREAGWRFLGSDRDSAGIPAFRTADDTLYIEERIFPAAAVGGAHLVRELIIRAKNEPVGVTVRAWTSPEIAQRTGATNNDGWKADNGPTIFVTGGPAFVRTNGSNGSGEPKPLSELLVPVGFRTGSDPERPYEARIRLEYAW